MTINRSNSTTVNAMGVSPRRDPLLSARTAHERARRNYDPVHGALNGLDALGMRDIRAALDRVIEPLADAALDACCDYSVAVDERDERLAFAAERAVEHASIVREREALLAAAVRDADRRARRARRPDLRLAPAWVGAAIDLLPLFSLDDDGRLIEEPF